MNYVIVKGMKESGIGSASYVMTLSEAQKELRKEYIWLIHNALFWDPEKTFFSDDGNYFEFKGIRTNEKEWNTMCYRIVELN